MSALRTEERCMCGSVLYRRGARCQAFPPGVTAIANYTRRHCVLLQGAGEAALEWKFPREGVESVAFGNWCTSLRT